MGRIIPPKYRYPMFFMGIMLMIGAGFASKYVGAFTQTDVEAAVSLGFVIFVLSIAL